MTHKEKWRNVKDIIISKVALEELLLKLLNYGNNFIQFIIFSSFFCVMYSRQYVYTYIKKKIIKERERDRYV